MEPRKNFYKLVSAFLIVSFFAPSVLLWPKNVEAQVTGPQPGETSFYDASFFDSEATINQPQINNNFFQNSESGGGDIPGPNDSKSEKWQEKSCGKLVGGAVKSLFKKQVTEKVAQETLKKALEEGGNESGAVPVFSVTLNKKIDLINEKTTDIQTSTGYLFKKAGCLDSLAKLMMKVLIQKVTLSIINWINYGRDGKPLFLSDPAGYFTNIAKEEIQGFGLSINNSARFPFGKAFFTGVILDYKMKFENQAEYSLDKLIARTNPGKVGIDFNTNFNTGGWGAWLGMTYPQNNPIGFNMIAADELSVRLAGTQKSRAEYVNESIRDATGFLGDERCAAPEGVTHKEDAEARNGVAGKRLCKKWVYVTPGKLIADLAIDSTKAPIKRLELADDINSALAAIADAGVNKFFAKLTDPNGRGLLGFSEADNTGTYDITSNLAPSSSSTIGTQFPEFFVTPGSWISDHLDFDIRTDVTQAFVDEQRTYSAKLAQYNDAVAELILWIRQLDYCIPGPNPNWEQNTSELVSGIGGVNPAGKNGWDITSEILSFSSLASAIPGAGTWIALGGTLAGIGAGWAGGEKADKENKNAAANAVERLLEVNIDNAQDQMVDQGGINALISNVYNEYQKKIRKIYFSGTQYYMPGVTGEARSLFQSIPGYQKIIQNNQEEIIFRKSIITRLENLKKKIDELNEKLELGINNGGISGEDYEKQFHQTSPLVSEFGRLSAYFVDGDNIANVDNLAKEALGQKKYVHDDLLTGTFGCEKEMEKLAKDDKLSYSTYARRQPYPFPIDHLYASVKDTSGKLGWADGPYAETWTQSTYNSYNALWWEGFLYGTAYYNGWASPGIPTCPEYNKYYDDGNITLMKDASSGSEGVNALVHLSLPNSDKDGKIQDIGGLNISGDLANNCGVITNGFEKTFMVY